MALKDLTEVEIMQKVKGLYQEKDLYADVIKQYFQEIFHRYYYQCYNLSRYYGLTRQDAEDAVQEAVRRVLARNRPFASKDAVQAAYREFAESGKTLGVSELLGLKENGNAASFCFRDPGSNCWEIATAN